jgi:hypothetical protein
METCREWKKLPLLSNEISESNKVSEIPCRVSSDLHEWSNELNAVSSTSPVKL